MSGGVVGQNTKKKNKQNQNCTPPPPSRTSPALRPHSPTTPHPCPPPHHPPHPPPHPPPPHRSCLRPSVSDRQPQAGHGHLRRRITISTAISILGPNEFSRAGDTAFRSTATSGSNFEDTTFRLASAGFFLFLVLFCMFWFYNHTKTTSWVFLNLGWGWSGFFFDMDNDGLFFFPTLCSVFSPPPFILQRTATVFPKSSSFNQSGLPQRKLLLKKLPQRPVFFGDVFRK